MSLSKMADTRVSKGHYSASLRLKTEIYRKKIFFAQFFDFSGILYVGRKIGHYAWFSEFPTKNRKVGRSVYLIFQEQIRKNPHPLNAKSKQG